MVVQSSQSSRSGPSSQSATTTQTQTQTQNQNQSQDSLQPILVLRAEAAETRHIQWAEDVVDNEGMGKKSSKVCCIYHKPHSANESSGDESSSSESSSSESSSSESDTDSDSEPDTSKAQPSGSLKDGKRKKQHRNHRHDHANPGDYARQDDPPGGRRPRPNAYERVPRYKQSAASEQTNVATK